MAMIGFPPLTHARRLTVENARLYTLPDALPPIIVAGGPLAADLARCRHDKPRYA